MPPFFTLLRLWSTFRSFSSARPVRSGARPFRRGRSLVLECLENRLVPAVDLQVGIVDAPDPVIAGSGIDNLSYAVSVRNGGTTDAIDVALDLSALLPGGVMFSSAAGDGVTTFAGTETATWAVGDLNVGTTKVLTVTYTVAANTVSGAQVSLTADNAVATEIGNPRFGPPAALINPGDDAATANTTVGRQSDLQVTIDDSPDPISAGSNPENLVYLVVVRNAGPSYASGVTLDLTGTLPPGATFVSAIGDGTNSLNGPGTGTWSIGNLTDGGTATLEVTYTVAADAADNSTVSLVASNAQANEPLINPGDDGPTASTLIQRRVDLEVTVGDNGDPVVAGSSTGNLVYMVTVRNLGPSDASGVAVDLTGTLPPGVSFVSAIGAGTNAFGGAASGAWNIGSLASGATATLTVTYTVDAAAPYLSTVSLLANNARAAEALIFPEDDADTETTGVDDQTKPAVLVVGPSQAFAKSGGSVTYTVTLSDTNIANANPIFTLVSTGTATGTLTSAPTGTTATTRTFQLTVAVGAGNGTLGVNVAAGAATDLAGNSSDAATTTTFIVDNTPPLIRISAPSRFATQNSPVTFTVTYSDANLAQTTLTAANITLYRTGTANGTVSVSGSGTVYTVTVSNPSGTGHIGLTLAGGTAVDQAGNTALTVNSQDFFEVDHSGPKISISPPSKTTASSGIVTYKVTYSDPRLLSVRLTAKDILLRTTGTARADVAVSGIGATRTVTLSHLRGNGSLRIEIKPGTAVDSFGNASLGAGPSASVRLVGSRHLTVTQGPVPATIDAGRGLAFTYSYANSGNQEAANVVLKTTLPEFTTFDSAHSTPGWSHRGNGVYTLAIGTLLPGRRGTAVFTVFVSASTPDDTRLVNRVAVTDGAANGLDLNSAVAEVTVRNPNRSRLRS